MSMTPEEAIELLCYGDWLNVISEHIGKQDTERIAKAMCIVGKALHPVSRERVEKAEWIWSTGDVYICSSCGEKTHVDERMETPIYNFCPFCMSPMTDEAVQMAMERLNKLEETKK